MKKLYPILALLLTLSGNLYAANTKEVIADFKEESLPVLNEALRNLGSGDNIADFSDASVPVLNEHLRELATPCGAQIDTIVDFSPEEIPVINENLRRLDGCSNVTFLDPYTILLLHFDGTNGSTVFKDSSITPKTVSDESGGVITTSKKKFGTGSLTGNTIKVAANSAFDFGASSFTIDCWVNFANAHQAGATDHIFRKAITFGTFCFDFWIGYPGGGSGASNIKFEASDNGAFTGLPPHSAAAKWLWEIPASNTWYHFALVKNGDAVALYIDGTLITPDDTWNGASGFTIFTSSDDVYIHGYKSGESGIANNMNIDELRVSNVARWTADFTPPTKAY